MRKSGSLGPSLSTRSCNVAIVKTYSYSGFSALLRSLEGEALEDYSKRAYKVCRTNGIIHHNALDLEPTSAPWRASSLVQPCRFGSANSIPGVSTIRGIERESQDIQKGETSFREDSQRHGMVDSGLDTISLVDNAAENCPISNDYASVIDDMSASEEALPHPVLAAFRPPSEKMRPRLETARAGRALASASSNTREGSARSRKELNGPQLDLSGNPLPLPPHVLKPSDCVWKDDGPLRSTSGPSCNGKHEGERFGGVTGNPDLIAGGNVADGRVVLLSPRESCSPHSNKLERGRLAWSPVGGTGRRGDDDPLTVEPTLQREDSSPVDSKKDVCSAREHKDRNVGEYGIAELGDDKRKVEKVTDRFARSTTPPRVIHSRQMAIKPGMAAPVALSNDIEHLTPSREDDDAFVWFGEPDSPTCHRSTENVEVAADTRGRGQTCHLQHQRNKAKLILAMDVRRQRSIIECALRARERVWRMRRSNLGAEVLMKFYALRRNGEIKKLSQEHQPFSDADQQGNGRAKEINVPEITALRSNRRGARSPEKSPIRVEAKAVPGIKDTTERTEARRPGDEPEPDTVAGEPFVSREDHGGISVTRVSAPLPVSFEVVADGITGLGVEGGGKQEQARRQKRLEALRVRKEAEAKVLTHLLH